MLITKVQTLALYWHVNYIYYQLSANLHTQYRQSSTFRLGSKQAPSFFSVHYKPRKLNFPKLLSSHQKPTKHTIYSLHRCHKPHAKVSLAFICHLHAHHCAISSPHESTCLAACTSCSSTARQQTLYPEIWPALVAGHHGRMTKYQLAYTLRKSLISMHVWHRSLATIFALPPLKMKIMEHPCPHCYSKVMYQVSST